MSSFLVVPVDDRTAGEIRRTRMAPAYGHPAHSEVATGRGPCRVCLRRFRPDAGERRLLVTHDSFRGVEPFPQPGPIFIHEDPCAPYRACDRFPVELVDEGLTFHGYGEGAEPIATLRTSPPQAGESDEDRVREAEDTIRRLLEKPSVRYVQVRSTAAGCFLFHVDRAEAPYRAGSG
jgi:Protein of unknown function (DUF1203)